MNPCQVTSERGQDQTKYLNFIPVKSPRFCTHIENILRIRKEIQKCKELIHFYNTIFY